MTNQNIEKSLVERCKYTEKQASLLVKELMQVDLRLIPVLNKWVDDGIETDFNVCGFTLLEIKSRYNMTYPAALLTIDWLVKDPKVATEAIEHGLK